MIDAIGFVTVLGAGFGLPAAPATSVEPPHAVSTMSPSSVFDLQGQSTALAGPSPDAVSMDEEVPNTDERYEADPRPMMWSLRSSGYGVDITPYSSFTANAYGSTSETTATFKMGAARALLANRLQALGVRTQRPYGGSGQFYLFATVRNLTFNANPLSAAGGFAKPNWVVASAPTLLSDDRVGLGWSKGAMAASFGYVQRQTRVINAPVGFANGRNESVAALSLTFRPH